MTENKTRDEMMQEIHDNGINVCGADIAQVAKVLHPDAEKIIPMYRSALVILPTVNGQVKMIHYHDPHWMGEREITPQNLVNYSNDIVMSGQRSGVDIFLNNSYMVATPTE